MTNGPPSYNSISNGHVKSVITYPVEIMTVPEMCMYCFDVLDSELNDYSSPLLPSFPDESQLVLENAGIYLL